jgi:hypothetical protein
MSTLPPQLPATMTINAGERPVIDHQTERSEGTMNENRGNRTPNWGLLLLVPAVFIVAKAARHHRAMWEGSEYHARFGGADGVADARATFRLPPKLEWMLDTWHTRAHQAAGSTEPATT